MKYYSIAIDGPAGAGKSTIAKKFASELGFTYIDTGAMYRAITLFYVEKGIDCSDEASVCRYLSEIDVDICYIDEAQHVLLNGADVTGSIRTQKVSDNASKISAIGQVREKLVALQQQMARSKNVVMDGRDIGSVVLPFADLKIYLTASVEVRAKRRFQELVEKGTEADLSTIAKEIEERDWRDMHRENSPLVCVEDAKVVDTSDMTIDEVTTYCMKLFDEVKGCEQ
ncbi:MAG: (d)CMP kinase [Lachnospiraceae bacterium]|nr:(d)CMP kinase [Lachnospiraceae bacterium]